MLGDKPVGFVAIQHFPHPKAKNIKRVHRLVVLPDFQGIGIGTRLLNHVAQHYLKQGFRMRIVTSTPALLHSLKKTGWRCDRIGRTAPTGNTSGLSSYWDSASKRNTYSFELSTQPNLSNNRSDTMNS